MSAMRRLVLDIETSPSLAHVWGLWNQNVSLSQLRESGRVICFAAKWYGERGVLFYSDFHDGHEAMVRGARELMDEADAIIHYNGKRFDMPHLHREILTAKLDPPSPHQDIDLCDVAKRRFRFVSNKLDHVAAELGVGSKVKHAGHSLWTRCMAGEEKAWDTMRRYNVGDVRLTEKLYTRLLPWIPGHPNHNLYTGDAEDVCPNCGGSKLQRRGYKATGVSTYQQYQCQDCGRWCRGKQAIERADLRPA